MPIDPATPMDRPHMDAALRALADPTRREILRLVHDDERAVKEIAERFEMSRPAISQHLRVLEDAALVSARKDGTRRFYRARPETVTDLIDDLEAMWDDSLARLKRVAEQAEWPARAKRIHRTNPDDEDE